MISNPLKLGKKFHFSVRWLNQTLSLSLSRKNQKSNLDTAQFYILSCNSNPNEFRPRCIPPTPKITAKQSDSTRRFNLPRARNHLSPISSTVRKAQQPLI